MNAADVDIAIIGAGIVGLSAAWCLQKRRPDWRILIIEKEADVAVHQSGRNSGVVHAGVYYSEGSLKARFCREGLRQTRTFCEQHDLPYEQCGKLIVARDALEQQRLDVLFRRARNNNLNVSLLNKAALQDREPNIVGASALLVPETAITDYRQISLKLRDLLIAGGAEFIMGEAVTEVAEDASGVTVSTDSRTVRADRLLCCAGLMADNLVLKMGLPCDFRILPFRGEFYQLAQRCESWFNHLVYPVPDPRLPFLGVHLTLMVGGGVSAGPNAVLGWRKEAYRRGDVDLVHSLATLGYPGFWKLLSRYWRPGLGEVHNSYCQLRYLKLLQSYCPALRREDLLPMASGVRAQAVNSRGELIQDFHFVESARSLHVCNAPSPAATSALPIGQYIANRMLGQG